GRHRNAPALGGRAPEVEREVDRRRGAHAADRRQQREHEPPALAKVAEVELAPRLKTQHEDSSIRLPSRKRRPRSPTRAPPPSLPAGPPSRQKCARVVTIRPPRSRPRRDQRAR